MTGRPTMDRAADDDQTPPRPCGRPLLARGDLERRLEEHRRELTAHCRRVLGSRFDADDAVQETLLRAWRAYDRFEGRASLRSWLYRIATNACFDMLEGRRRRPHSVDLATWQSATTSTAMTATATSSGVRAGAGVAVTRPDTTWIAPLARGEVTDPNDDPADQVVARESVRQAFLAALLHLPAKQRSVLILRDVLRWRASEVAELLDTSEASVNSALQRARATMAARPSAAEPAVVVDEKQRPLLESYVDAFLRYDVDSLVSLVQCQSAMAL